MNKKEIEQEMERYEEMDFGYWQMSEIRKGLEKEKQKEPEFLHFHKKLEEILKDGHIRLIY